MAYGDTDLVIGLQDDINKLAKKNEKLKSKNKKLKKRVEELTKTLLAKNTDIPRGQVNGEDVATESNAYARLGRCPKDLKY